MATQSLYRRYRPRRFSELKGQDHVVRALREAVRAGREGQAYLFSGPRGTGKTTSARILAKVLNCQNPSDGEPCCECESCIAVEQGTSYDVHELDAASNNGVDAMRDLIERASLGTPGRHKVYILDEVHMLSRAAEAALLKTLEEPPPHVVFVLATTDPQRVSDTIRSRTQHLRFHLLASETLAHHVRWVADDAGLAIGDQAIDLAISQGGGSARDTLSALELIASSGGDDDADTVALDEFVDALAASDAGRALTVIARAINRGDDARTLTDRLVRHLRDGFLSLMAPELVQLASHRVELVGAAAKQLGAARLVRAIEVLGEMLVEMRHAPDPRLVLEVATFGLCGHDAASADHRLEERLERLEHAVDTLAAATPTATPAPRPGAGDRATIGGRAKRAASAADQITSGTDAATAPPDAAAAAGAGSTADDGGAAGVSDEPVSAAAVQAIWSSRVLTKLPVLQKALFATGSVADSTTPDGHIVVQLPSDHLRQRCEEHRAAVEQVLTSELGRSVRLMLSAAPPEPEAPAAASEEHHIDPDDLVDAPGQHDPLSQLAEAFPGSEIVPDPDRRR